MTLLKYDAAGNLKWERPYDGPAHLWDDAVAVGVDRSGNVVIVGHSTVSGFQRGIVLIKFDAAGNALWPAPARFDPDLADPNATMTARQAALDPGGNVYVVGDSGYTVSGAFIENALALKFAAADGRKAWGQVYTPRKNTDSYFESLAVGGTTVACVGSTYGTRNDGLVVKYGFATGAEKFWKEWGAGNATGEWFGDVVLDAKGNTYVTGDQWLATPTGYDKGWTMKLSPTLAKIVWKQPYLPATRGAEGWYIERDGLGNIYVAGVRDNVSEYEDFLTIKYSPTGARKWLKVWSAGGPDDDEPSGLVLGSSGTLYVGGDCTMKDDTYRAVLLKYQR
ncbi:MAG TPA: hypothetical protein VJ787_10415 [Thermoleophilia bacterium]|nr:hypothetical protein [Thermoleophilia bacterium]